jgi:uncharacterized protein (DUF58 family)
MTALVVLLCVAVFLLVVMMSFLIGFTIGVISEKDARAGEETDAKFDPEFHRPVLSLYEQEREAGSW